MVFQPDEFRDFKDQRRIKSKRLIMALVMPKVNAGNGIKNASET